MSDEIVIEASTQSPYEGSDNESDDSEINEEELKELNSFGVSSIIKHNAIFAAKAKVWKLLSLLLPLSCDEN
jgi:hypothetical protein